MQKLSISRFRAVVVLIMDFCFVMPCLSQVSKTATDAYLGKIQVYRFTMDSLNYKGSNEKLSAVGKEFLADLYSSSVGDNAYFRIFIDGNSYAVVLNPYGTKESSGYYYAAWILKGGKYVKSPTLGYVAGPYFLSLPYAKADVKTATGTTTNVSSISTSDHGKAKGRI